MCQALCELFDIHLLTQLYSESDRSIRKLKLREVRKVLQTNHVTLQRPGADAWWSGWSPQALALCSQAARNLRSIGVCVLALPSPTVARSGQSLRGD